MPPLDEQAAIELLRGAVPSLTQSLLKRVFEVSGGRPGELRRLVRIIASDAPRAPYPALSPQVRATLVEMARRLDLLVLRWGR